MGLEPGDTISYNPSGVTMAAFDIMPTSTVVDHDMTITLFRTPLVAAESVRRIVGQFDEWRVRVTTDLEPG